MDQETLEEILSEGEAVGISFSGEDLSFRDFTGVVFRDCTFSSCRLEGMAIRGGGIMSSRIIDSDLARIECQDARLADVSLVSCRLPGASFARSSIKRMEIISSSGLYASFSSSHASCLCIRECMLEDSSFEDMKCTSCSIEHTSLRRSQFRGTWLRDIRLCGSDIEGIALSPDLHELRGAVLDTAQALSVARLLGIELG